MAESPLALVAEPGYSPAPVRACIHGLGVALPEAEISSAVIASGLGVEEEWLVERTGIRSRRRAGESDTLHGLATTAAARALADAGIAAEEVDLVLVASLTQDQLLPNAAPQVAEALGAQQALACDIGAACNGFVSALSLAAAHIESARGRAALVVGADLLSRVTDHEDRKTAGLFADGAGAVVVASPERGAGAEIERMVFGVDGGDADCIVVEHDQRMIRMRGQDTFRAAVDHLSALTREILGLERLHPADVDVFVFHQANGRILDAVAERLGVEEERVINCIGGLGNTSAASVPLALHAALECGRLRPGARVLIAAFGAGFVWGGGLLRWNQEMAR